MIVSHFLLKVMKKLWENNFEELTPENNQKNE